MPLSVIVINEKHNFNVFEAGISTVVDEMQTLQNYPTYHWVTHQYRFGPRWRFWEYWWKNQRKLQLFKDVDVLIYNKNKTIEQFLPSLGIPTSGTRNLFSWSCKDKEADVFIRKNVVLDKTHLMVHYQKENFEVKVPFLDDASVENSIQCLMVLLYFWLLIWNYWKPNGVALSRRNAVGKSKTASTIPRLLTTATVQIFSR